MLNWKKLALGLMLVCSCTSALAAESTSATETPKPYNFVYEMGKQMPTINLVGEVTKEEMEARLHSDTSDDLLYMLGASEKIMTFRYLADDRASCKQIVFASPVETVIQFYTNDKKTWKQMYKTLHAYAGEWNLVDGYKVVADKHLVAKLDNKKAIYRIWFKKVKPDNRAVRVVGYPTPYPYYYDYPVRVGLYWNHWRHYGPGHHYRTGPHPRPHPGPRPGPRPRRQNFLSVELAKGNKTDVK